MAGTRLHAEQQPPDKQTGNGRYAACCETVGLASSLAAKADRPLRLIEFLPVAILALGVIASLAYASLKPRHVAGETLGVVTIGGSPDAAIAAVSAAGGEILRDGNVAHGVIARAPDVGFVARLYAAGIFLVYRIDRNSNCAAVTEAAGRQAEAAALPGGVRSRLAMTAAEGS
jgi:hypothetical protein